MLRADNRLRAREPKSSSHPRQQRNLVLASAALVVDSVDQLLMAHRNDVLIPGTSSLEHLREDIQASMLQIPSEVLTNLDSIGGHDEKHIFPLA